MTTELKDIYWLAGLLEGEGCFTLRNPTTSGHRSIPVITLAMTDKDIVTRAAMITAGKCNGPYKRKCKDMYRLDLVTNKAIPWMMTIYSLMGERRKQKIEEIQEYWKKTRKQGKHIKSRSVVTGRFMES